ncbi:serine--tRNA ligase, partial [Enterococcus faecalis]
MGGTANGHFVPSNTGSEWPFFYGKIKGGCITMLDVKMIRQNFAEVQS